MESDTEETGLGLFAVVDFGVDQIVAYFEKDGHYTSIDDLRKNVRNQRHVVKGPNGWHDQTYVAESFIEDTNQKGTWVPKKGRTGHVQGLGTFANSSNTPNCKLHVHESGIWLLDIAAGCEITHKHSLSGAQTPQKKPQQSGTEVIAMQVEDNAYKRFEEWNVTLSAKYGKQQSSQNGSVPTQLKLIPQTVDEERMYRFELTAARSLDVKAESLWQSRNVNTDSLNANTEVRSAGLLQGKNFVHVRCEMAPELNKNEGAPWFG